MFYKLKNRLSYFIFNKSFFSTEDVKIGKGVKFGKNVIFKCKRVRIGDGVIFHDNILIETDTFEIGDYGNIYPYCFFPGPGKISIGHNFWLGKNSIIDSQGGTKIGNNVGIGASSQLWTHMKFGDTLAGCRFNSSRSLIIGDDVWLVGHVLVSPVTIGDRSLVMLGSVIVNDIPSDRTYAGVPAKDFTEKFGTQFETIPPDKIASNLNTRIDDYANKYNIFDIWSKVDIVDEWRESITYSKVIFNVKDRTYLKTGSKFEQQLIRFLLPEAKFVPKEIQKN